MKSHSRSCIELYFFIRDVQNSICDHVFVRACAKTHFAHIVQKKSFLIRTLRFSSVRQNSTLRTFCQKIVFVTREKNDSDTSVNLSPEPSKIILSSHQAESASFPPGSETEIWHFRPRCEEKQYTLHGSKIGQPSSRVCTRYGLSKFCLPQVRNVLLSHQGKCASYCALSSYWILTRIQMSSN